MGRVTITEEQKQRAIETGRLEYTPEQREDTFADNYVDFAFDYGLQYYGAARFAFASHFQPVSSTLLHHAVEMFLQGCVALKDTPAQIRKYRETYFSHKLPKLWEALKTHYADAGLEEFDDAIAALEKFREIRFPESLAEHGGMMQTGFADPPPRGYADPAKNDRYFGLDVRPIDKLVVKLFAIADRNPGYYASKLKHPEAARFFTLWNESPLLP